MDVGSGSSVDRSPPADLFRPGSPADPALLNTYLRLQIEAFERAERERVERERSSIERRAVLHRVVPVAVWILILFGVAVLVSLLNWDTLKTSIGQSETILGHIEEWSKTAGTGASAALAHTDLLVPAIAIVWALVLRATTVRLEATAIIIVLGALMVTALYPLAAVAEATWSWRRSALFFLPGLLIGVALVQQLAAIEMHLYRGSRDHWQWYHALYREHPAIARAWTVASWAGRIARSVLRTVRPTRPLTLVAFLFAPVLILGVLLGSPVSRLMAAGDRPAVVIALFSAWGLWGLGGALATPRAFRLAAGTWKRRLFVLIALIGLLAPLATLALRPSGAVEDLVVTLAFCGLLLWSPWAIGAAVVSRDFFQPARRPITMFVFAILPSLCMLTMVWATLSTPNGYDASVPADAAWLFLIVIALLCCFLWYVWALAALPTGLRQTYASLFVWTVLLSLSSPNVFLVAAFSLLNLNIPLSVWRARTIAAPEPVSPPLVAIADATAPAQPRELVGPAAG